MTTLSDLLNEVEDTLLYQEEEIKADIANQILGVLHQLEITQADLATAMKVKPSYVSRITSASENMSIRTLVKIAAALNKAVSIKFSDKAQKVSASEYRKQLLDGLAKSANKPTAYERGLRAWPAAAANNESFHPMDFSHAETSVA